MKSLITIVQDTSISGYLYPTTRPDVGLPLLVTLHGGSYTHTYWTVGGSSAGSFIDIANRNGFSVLAMDRPGCGTSDQLPEEQNTFARQAELLDAALSEMLRRLGRGSVVVVGHSIGGMIALELAARHPTWGLLGVSVTGMGSRTPPGGAAEQLGLLPFSGVVDLPLEEREKIYYGPEGSYTDEAVLAARSTYASVPMVELTSAPAWAADRLPEVAADIEVPVQHQLAQFDSLWDSSLEAREDFLAKFDPGHAVESAIVPGVGHCIDHHLLGADVHYKQLGFAHSCWCRTEYSVEVRI